MSDLISRPRSHRPPGRRPQSVGSPGRFVQHQPLRRQSWAGRTPQQILEQYRPGKAPPLKVLDVLLALFNSLHTSLEKTVSHKTRHERSQFLRRFFRDLHDKAGFKKLPDPRNLGQKHLRAMVQVWQREHLAPATIQTYLSFLRGLGMWMGKHGFVRAPAYYGLKIEEYQRHESAQRDRSWSAQGIDIDALLTQVFEYDRYIGASLGLVRAMGLRRKESVLFRPFEHVAAFADTGLPPEEREADRYVLAKGKGGRARWIALDRPVRLAALELAQSVVGSRDAHMGDPSRDLKRNLRRFDYVLKKFGITLRERGVTGHGLRHEVLIDIYQELTGVPPPVRGGAPAPSKLDKAARQAVSRLAGHARTRAAGAYLAQPVVGRSKSPKPGDDDALPADA